MALSPVKKEHYGKILLMFEVIQVYRLRFVGHWRNPKEQLMYCGYQLKAKIVEVKNFSQTTMRGDSLALKSSVHHEEQRGVKNL